MKKCLKLLIVIIFMILLLPGCHKHNYKDRIVEPTCTKQGYTIHECNCGYSYTDNYTNIVDHNYIDNICEWCGKTKPSSSLDTYEENGYTYINLGRYPQTVVDNEETITALSSITKTNSRGYIEYNGNEYKKVVASTYESGYKFINGNAITNGNTYYYLVEPIKWRVLKEDDNSYTLMCEMVLDNTCFYESIDNRTINENTIYPNNYEYSNIRAWLNGYKGTSYNVTNYTNIGFFDIAFTEEEQALIKTTLVDNSAQTTDSSTNPYVCNNTNDKVYLLSQQDMINSSYGFSTDPDESDTARRGTTTDYARSKGCYMSTETGYYGNAYWWLRSPACFHSIFARNVYYIGYVYHNSVSYSFYGVRPAITITK